MPEKYEVIVVGAGPAGSLFSLITARAGLKTLLLDRNHFPRPKVCGGYLKRDCWKIWEKLDLTSSFSDLQHREIHRISLSLGHAPPFFIEEDSKYPANRAVSRLYFDEWLKNQAVAAGVECVTGGSTSKLNDSHTLETSHGIIQGNILVGADGRDSWLARRGKLRRTWRSGKRIAWHTIIPASLVKEELAIHFMDDGYWMTVPFSDTEANLSLVLDGKTSLTPQAIVQRHLPEAPALNWRSTAPIIRREISPASDNILLLGDAVRIVEPIRSEGVNFALLTAYHAAALTVACHRAGNYRKLPLLYAEKHRHIYHRAALRNQILRFTGQHPRLTHSLLEVKSFQRMMSSLVMGGSPSPALSELDGESRSKEATFASSDPKDPKTAG